MLVNWRPLFASALGAGAARPDPSGGALDRALDLCAAFKLALATTTLYAAAAGAGGGAASMLERKYAALDALAGELFKCPRALAVREALFAQLLADNDPRSRAHTDFLLSLRIGAFMAHGASARTLERGTPATKMLAFSVRTYAPALIDTCLERARWRDLAELFAVFDERADPTRFERVVVDRFVRVRDVAVWLAFARSSSRGATAAFCHGYRRLVRANGGDVFALEIFDALDARSRSLSAARPYATLGELYDEACIYLSATLVAALRARSSPEVNAARARLLFSVIFKNPFCHQPRPESAWPHPSLIEFALTAVDQWPATFDWATAATDLYAQALMPFDAAARQFRGAKPWRATEAALRYLDAHPRFGVHQEMALLRFFYGRPLDSQSGALLVLLARHYSPARADARHRRIGVDLGTFALAIASAASPHWDELVSCWPLERIERARRLCADVHAYFVDAGIHALDVGEMERWLRAKERWHDEIV